MSVGKREERLRSLKEYGADRVWQPILDAVLETYQKFEKDSTKCNIVLLIAERNHFHEFYVYFLKPALPKRTVYFSNWISGYSLKKEVETVKQKIIFLQDELDWLARASKESRAKSVRDLLEAAREGRKFLILCGYNYEMNRFRELLSLAFPDEKPEIKEFILKPLP